MSDREMIGPYEVVEQVGSGGMATVYKAYQPRLDRHVAIKVMHQMFTQEAEFISRFEREARIVASLDHPHILPMYDYDEHKGQPYLVMKFIEGETLKDILKKRTLPLEDIRRMVRQVADALTYAHEQGVLHRDIKPSNIMIDQQGNAYLTDFGLARITAQGESTISVDTMLGTPHYISPEQAKGLPEIDARTDVYSFGVILYELVAGRVPFVGESAYAIVHKQIYAEPAAPSELNPELPSEVDEVFLRALAKDPARRYATPNALMQAFERAITSSGLKALDESRVSIAQKRGEDISHRTPGGGKYVSIPAPIGGPSPAPGSFDDVIHDVGQRFRQTFNEVKGELQKSQVVNNIAASVREVAQELQESFSSSSQAIDGKTGQVNVHIDPDGSKAQRLIEKDWSMDEDSVRRRVNQRITERTWFFVHLLVFLVAIFAIFITQAGARVALMREFTDPAFVEEFGTFLQPLVTLRYALIIALLWGAGVLEHLMGVIYCSGRHLEKRREALLSELEAYHGANWKANISAREYKRLRRRVNKRFSDRRHFMGHFIWFVMSSMAVLVAWPSLRLVLMGWPEFPPMLEGLLVLPNLVPGLIILFFAFTVLIHGVTLLATSLVGNEATERAVRAEIVRERSRVAPAAKQKNENLQDLIYADRKPKNQAAAPQANATDADADTDEAAPRVRLTGDGEFTESFLEEIQQDDQRHHP